ncbi:hypothetical protein Q7P35_001303 [Cladosporium inversicolor]
MTANTIDSERIKQHSPFLNLPSELRLMIYAFALQNTVDEIKARAISPIDLKHPLLRGALALLSTLSLDLSVGPGEGREVVERGDLMRDVGGFVEWVYASVQAAEEEEEG